jgi:hypothetical protein
MGDVLELNADNPAEVDSGLRPTTSTFLAAAVGAPSGPLQLLIFSGTAIIGFEIPDAQQGSTTTGREQVEIILQRNLAPADFLGSTTYAALASVNNDTDDNLNFGYRVTRTGTLIRFDGTLRLIADIAVGYDSIFGRMSYQCFVLLRPSQ